MIPATYHARVADDRRDARFAGGMTSVLAPSTVDAMLDDGRDGDTETIAAVAEYLRQPNNSPVRRLLFAVLADAINDAFKPSESVRRQAARDWLLDGTEELGYTVTARMCAEAGKLNYDALARRLERAWRYEHRIVKLGYRRGVYKRQHKIGPKVDA